MFAPWGFSRRGYRSSPFDDFFPFPSVGRQVRSPVDEFFEDFFHAPTIQDEKETKDEQAKEGESESSTKDMPAEMKSKKYTYHHQTTIDADGKKVENMRKHYEDSTGKSKTWEERKVGDKTFRKIWDKADK